MSRRRPIFSIITSTHIKFTWGQPVWWLSAPIYLRSFPRLFPLQTKISPGRTTQRRSSSAPRPEENFALHFPSYGSVRIANSLEQLKACGIKYVFGLGLGGSLQEDIAIGDVFLLEGAVRGDGTSRYYAPDEYPAVPDFALTSQLREALEANHEKYHLGLSFGTDALYREEESLIGQLSELGVISIDLESSAFLTVGRRLGLKCAWVGVVSDRLVGAKHEGTIHSGHVMEALSRLSGYIVQIIDQSL